jgi:vacuolar-type H+-ATPase subunit I/STV1
MKKFQEHYFQEDDKESFINEVKDELNKLLLQEQETFSSEINPQFITRLLNYLESRCFVSYGEFDQKVGNEIRQYVKGDNSYIKKVKQRIHEIINKAKSKFLRNIQDKVEKVKILPKEEPKPPQSYKPLAVDDALRGDSSYEPNL